MNRAYDLRGEPHWHDSCLNRIAIQESAVELAAEGQDGQTRKMGQNAMKTLQGHLLVASPHLTDTPFSKSVILLLEHNESGAMGVVLNRTMDRSLKQTVERLGGQPLRADGPVSVGGPVGGPLVALKHQESGTGIQLPSHRFSKQDPKKLLSSILKESKGAFRVFIGHAGWAEGQLERELEQGIWMTQRATAEHVFGHHEDLWAQTVREIGQSVIRAAVNIKHVPEHPWLN
jgi:putative transcriptional regulator